MLNLTPFPAKKKMVKINTYPQDFMDVFLVIYCL